MKVRYYVDKYTRGFINHKDKLASSPVYITVISGSDSVSVLASHTVPLSSFLSFWGKAAPCDLIKDAAIGYDCHPSSSITLSLLSFSSRQRSIKVRWTHPPWVSMSHHLLVLPSPLFSHFYFASCLFSSHHHSMLESSRFTLPTLRHATSMCGLLSDGNWNDNKTLQPSFHKLPDE